MEDKLRKSGTHRIQVGKESGQNEQCFRLKLENDLSSSQKLENLELSEIIDVQAIKPLMDDFYKLTHIPIGLNDLKGNVLIDVGWQDICTKFHRVCPETCKHCVESNIKLSLGVRPGELKLYKCKNNMWDVVTPIMVGDQHLGYVFAGQFFFEDEPVDYELFRSQARKYGFDEKEYIAALEKVPRLSREAVNTGMAFFMTFANMLSQLSYSNIKLAHSLEERNALVANLEKNREDFDRAQAVGSIGSWRLDVCKNELKWSDEVHRIFCIPKGTPLTYESFLSAVHPDDKEYVDKEWKAGLVGEPYDIEHRIIADGKIKWVREKAYIEFDKEGALTGGLGITQDITERRQAEEALRLSNLYNRSLIEASLDPLVTIGPDGKIMDVNGATEMVTGYSRSELIGTDFSDYFTEPEKARAGYQQVFTDGEVRDYPLEIQHKGGHITPVLYNASIYRDENSKVIGVFAAARDITAIKKAEEKIQTLANAVKSSDDAILTKSLDGIITNWNNGAEKVYGYLAEEVLGKNISIIEPDNTKGETKHLIEKIKQGERVQHYETLRMKKDKTIINVSVTFSPVFDSSGKLVAISTIARDITERKKAEEAIRLSNIYNRSLIEASLDPLVTIGPDGKITDVNGATEKVTGYSKNELIGTDFSDYFTEPEKARTGYQQVFKDGEVRDYPLGIQHKGGHITPVLYNASVYRDENSNVIGVFAAARDIAERKKAEEALKRAHESLEEKIKERTAELEKAYNSLKESEKGLAEAQKLAHIGNWDWNFVTGEVYWSDELYRIFGRSPQESGATYDELLNYVHPEDRDHVSSIIKKSLKEKPHGIDYRIILPNGEERIVHGHTEVIFNQDNIPVRAKGTVQDITESKLAQQKLQQSEEKYRFFVQSFKGITFQLDKELNVEFFHGAVKEITGYGEEELSSNDLWTQLVVPEDMDIFLEAETKVVQSPGDYLGEVEYRIKTKDEGIKWVYEIHQKIKNEKGEPVYTGVVYDITEKKEAKEALKKLEIIRKKEIHHRIKNNLQVISSLLDLQVEKFNNRQYIKNSEVIEAFRESQDRVMSIAFIHEELHEGRGDDALNFSLYLQRLLQNLFETYRFGDTEICLNLDLEENIFFDMDTAVPLGMIVNELVSNTLKYAFSGRKNGEIRIKLFSESARNDLNSKEQLTQKNTKYSLVVSDNGVGIPEKTDFENSDTLGLQLVNLLVDQLDGTIELEREKGTEFVIKFSAIQ